MIHTFKGFTLGNTVKLLGGDGRHHIIKEFQMYYDIKDNDPFAIVIFEDNSAKGFLSKEYTDLIKIK